VGSGVSRQVQGGNTRAPVPRFTALTPKERDLIKRVFHDMGQVALHALRKRERNFIARQFFPSQLVFPLG